MAGDSACRGRHVAIAIRIGAGHPPDLARLGGCGELLFVISGVIGVKLQAMIREVRPLPPVLIAALGAMVLVPEMVLRRPCRLGCRE